MAKKSKLLAALDAHQGRDYEKERQKKLQKLASKRRQIQAAKAPIEEIADGEEPSRPIVNGSESRLEVESEGWESDESEVVDEAADGPAVKPIMLVNLQCS